MASKVSGPPRRPGGPGAGGQQDARPGRRKDPRPRLPARAGRLRRGRGSPPGRHWPRRHWKAIALALTAVVLAGVLAWVLLGSTLLVVRSVRVTGTGTAVSARQVLGAARVEYGQQLIRVDTGAIARRVAQLRQVQSAQVSRDWPTTLVISVLPRKPVFALPLHDGYALVDAFGVTVRDVTRPPPGLPLLAVNITSRSLRGSPAVRAAAAVLAELPQQVARRVRAVTTGGPNDVSVKLANGAVVIWGGAERGQVKASELLVLLRRHARVYDVSGIGTAVTRG